MFFAFFRRNVSGHAYGVRRRWRWQRWCDGRRWQRRRRRWVLISFHFSSFSWIHSRTMASFFPFLLRDVDGAPSSSSYIMRWDKGEKINSDTETQNILFDYIIYHAITRLFSITHDSTQLINKKIILDNLWEKKNHLHINQKSESIVILWQSYSKEKKQGITPITQKWGRMDFKTPEVYQRTLSTLYHH